MTRHVRDKVSGSPDLLVSTWWSMRLIEPGKPNQNAHIESFNGRLRDECLSEHWFLNLTYAQAVIEAWRREYNEEQVKKA
jgi:putative transposase